LKQGRQDPAHWAAAQGRIAGQLGRHVVARDDAHHKPSASARIAEVERFRRLGETAHATACDFPFATTFRRLGPKRGHGARRIDDVPGLEQTSDARSSSRQGAEYQGAMRNGFVPRNPAAARQRASPESGN
jgi:hypothetical protein